MPYNLILTHGKQGPHSTRLCTSGGWPALAAWLDTLPRDKYPAAHDLSALGHYSPSSELAEQLEDALENHPPEDEDVKHTLDVLLDLLGAGDPGETATIGAPDS